MAKQSNLLIPDKPKSAGSSKFTPAFWADRIFRPVFTRDGAKHQVAEWYARIQHAGRREAVGLQTNTREEGARKAARLYQDVRSKGWGAALASFRPADSPRSVATIGEFLDTVKPILKTRERTFDLYAYALRRIALDVTGGKDTGKARFHPKKPSGREKADKIQLASLTPEKVERWKVDFIAKAGKNPVAAQKARRSVNSYVRCARALFGRKVLKRLGELSLPAPALPFAGVSLERQGSTRYVSTVNAVKLLASARAELSTKAPDAWKVILLALGAGLRRAEIDGLCWTQIDFDNSEIRILNHAHFEAKTDDSTGAVFVDATLLAELKPFVQETGFVVEGSTAPPTSKGQNYRCAATFAKVNAWLRANGVMTQKPLHTLRKEFGSLICAQSDIHTASRQLRHSTISTTAAYYADHRRRATVNVGEMLKEAK